MILKYSSGISFNWIWISPVFYPEHFCKFIDKEADSISYEFWRAGDIAGKEYATELSSEAFAAVRFSAMNPMFSSTYAFGSGPSHLLRTYRFRKGS